MSKKFQDLTIRDSFMFTSVMENPELCRGLLERGLYRYTCCSRCEETGEPLKDGRRTILLSTRGTNDAEVSKELVRLLKYVRIATAADRPAADAAPDDVYIESLKNEVCRVKRDRAKDGLYMKLQIVLEDAERKARERGFAQGRAEGHAEGRAEGLVQGQQSFIIRLLQRFGDVPQDIASRIEQETNEAVLGKWLLLAADAKDLNEFCRQL